jgi:arsenate reductase-like glutaredoxin family protein
MKIELDLQTDNLQEWINESQKSIESSIKYDVSRRVVDSAVAKIMEGVITTDYYSKESLTEEIAKKVMEKIEVQVNKIITGKLSEYRLEDKVKSLLNAQVRDMIDSKLNKIMSQLIIVDQSELNEVPQE